MITRAGMVLGLLSPVQTVAQACVLLYLVYSGEVLATYRVAHGGYGGSLDAVELCTLLERTFGRREAVVTAWRAQTCWDGQSVSGPVQ